MIRSVVFRPQAEAEVLAARQWYEERRAGLGDRFRLALDETVERIVAQAESFPRVHGNIRRALVQHFPFGIYFEMIDGQAVVLGVVQGRRDPETWKSRR
jgi:hypothetical protein